MRFAVLQFPASNCDQDCVHAVRALGHEANLLWHKDSSLAGYDAVIVPGGFSYGDYLRCGAIARFSPVVGALLNFANDGGLVIGICNGFQILCEAGLLPGALVRNRSLQFRCEQVFLKTVTRHSPFTALAPADRPIKIPIAHGDGCYFADEPTLRELEENDQILWQYSDHRGVPTEASNPNGSVRNIAGVCNKNRNVAGLMPHPDRASDPLLGSTDGQYIFKSMFAALDARVGA